MLERIAGIIREQLNLDNVEITEETSFNASSILGQKVSNVVLNTSS